MYVYIYVYMYRYIYMFKCLYLYLYIYIYAGNAGSNVRAVCGDDAWAGAGGSSCPCAGNNTPRVPTITRLECLP